MLPKSGRPKKADALLDQTELQRPGDRFDICAGGQFETRRSQHHLDF